MVTRTLAPLVIALAALAGCGDGGDAEAKQAALAPAAAKVAAAKTPAVKMPADSHAAANPALPAAPPVTKAATPGKPDSAGMVAASNVPVDSAAPAAAPEDNILGRESFSYYGGSRDPFASLLKSSRIGPELPDLMLVAIYYDTRTPSNSVVVMREKVGERKYNLRQGDRLGRLRISSVRPKDVTFTIDDFGTERQETVSLRKQENAQ